MHVRLRDFFERGGLILPPVWKGRLDEHVGSAGDF
jgi:hypothetical protein